jgi:hypothetical protein
VVGAHIEISRSRNGKVDKQEGKDPVLAAFGICLAGILDTKVVRKS